MGQHFIIANISKREYIDPARFGREGEPGNGGKFWEICVNDIAGVLPYLLRKSSSYEASRRTTVTVGPISVTSGGTDVTEDARFAGRWVGDSIMVIGEYDQINYCAAIEEGWTEISSLVAREYYEFYDS